MMRQYIIVDNCYALCAGDVSLTGQVGRAQDTDRIYVMSISHVID